MKTIIKRILAWIAIVLFILLIVNIFIFKYYPLESGLIYIFILLVSLFGRKRIMEYSPPEFSSEEDDEKTEEVN